MKTAVAMMMLCLTASVQGEGYIWQGFDHRWLRRIVTLETPHRLGSVANYLTNNATGWYSNMTFTPGVSGDYSHPETFYGKLPEGMEQEEYIAEAAWDDKLNNETAPSATSMGVKEFTIPRGSAVVLKGIRLDMHCNPALQPPSLPCNSNGDWLSNFNVSLTCRTETQCSVTVHLTRAWTPAHGGGKAINDVMSYHMRMPVQILSGLGLSSHNQKPLVQSGSTSTKEIKEEVEYVDVPNESSVVVGIRGVSFELFETDGWKNLGRYLERFAFHVGPFSRVWPSTTLEMMYKLGITSPATTTYPSKFTATLTPHIISWKTPSGQYPIPQQHVDGVVCMSGFAFSCRDHFLKESTNDLVALKPM